MAWIIKSGIKKLKVACPYCDAIIGFSENEKEFGYIDRFGRFFPYDYIICPECKRHIILKNCKMEEI